MQQGSVALRELGLADAAVAEDTPSGSHYVFTCNGEIIGCFGRVFAPLFGASASSKKSSKRHNVHLPRQRLREMLAQHVPPACIRWGQKVTGYKTTPEQVEVLLEDGTIFSADLLVGSDGIHSAVRRQLLGDASADCKHYLGVLVVLGMGPCTHPLVHERVWQMVDGDTRLFAMPFTVHSDGSPDLTFWQLSFPLPETQAHELAINPAGLSAEVQRRCAHWHAPLPQLLRDTELSAITAYAVYDRDPLPGPLHPPGCPHTQCRNPRVTIMGDAAHTMSPFKGQGANQALLDATGLAALIQQNMRVAAKRSQSTIPPGELCALLSRFEADMIGRTSSKVLGSREAAFRLHKPLVLANADDTGSARRLPGRAIQALKDAHIGAWSGSELDNLVLHVFRRHGVFEHGHLEQDVT